MKWTGTVLVVFGGTMGALASGAGALLALAGLLVLTFGLAIVRDWGGLCTALQAGYRRFGMPLPRAMLRITGAGFALIGAVLTVASLVAVLS